MYCALCVRFAGGSEFSAVLARGNMYGSVTHTWPGEPERPARGTGGQGLFWCSYDTGMDKPDVYAVVGLRQASPKASAYYGWTAWVLDAAGLGIKRRLVGEKVTSITKHADLPFPQGYRRGVEEVLSNFPASERGLLIIELAYEGAWKWFEGEWKATSTIGHYFRELKGKTTNLRLVKDSSPLHSAFLLQLTKAQSHHFVGYPEDWRDWVFEIQPRGDEVADQDGAGEEEPAGLWTEIASPAATQGSHRTPRRSRK